MEDEEYDEEEDEDDTDDNKEAGEEEEDEEEDKDDEEEEDEEGKPGNDEAEKVFASTSGAGEATRPAEGPRTDREAGVPSVTCAACCGDFTGMG